MVRPFSTFAVILTLLLICFGQPQISFGQIHTQGSVVDHYTNLFHGRSPATTAFGISSRLQPTMIRGFDSGNVASPQNFQRPPVAIQQPQVQFDSKNPFGQYDPQLQGTIKMPVVDHSHMLSITRLHRSQLFQMVQTGRMPTMQEMDGLWYGFNTGSIPRLVGFSQFIKDLRTNSPHPTGTNILVHQLPPDQLNNGKGWTPKVDVSKNRLAREGSFVILPPDGVGPFGHAAKGVYSLGNNPRNYPGNRIRTRIVMLDQNYMLGQSSVSIGGNDVHSGFFILQRLPVGALPRE